MRRITASECGAPGMLRSLTLSEEPEERAAEELLIRRIMQVAYAEQTERYVLRGATVPHMIWGKQEVPPTGQPGPWWPDLRWVYVEYDRPVRLDRPAGTRKRANDTLYGLTATPDGNGAQIITFGRSETSLLISEHHQAADGTVTVQGENADRANLDEESRIAERFYRRLAVLMNTRN